MHDSMLMGYPIEVVGIGADGWDGLPQACRSVVETADIVFGSVRQLGTLPIPSERTRSWPTPLLPALRSWIEEFNGRRICVLASGDPMFHGIGVTLAREFGATRIHVRPAPSSLSLACARLGWSVPATQTVNLVNTPVAALLPALAHGARVVALSRDETTPAHIAELLRNNGYAGSTVTVLEQLGGAAERVRSGVAGEWHEPSGDALNVVAIECVAEAAGLRLGRIPGLPDAAFGGDGQLTKQEVRALTLSALAPSPGELLWDVGGGSGSIAIEWMRTDPTCRAITFEIDDRRRQQIYVNATALGVPGLDVCEGAPQSFPDNDIPDAVFIGGGLTQDAMVDACWDRLPSGGRLIANAVTAESEALLLQCVGAFGGSLRKFQIYRGEPLGAFTGWRPHLPVAQWSAVKP